MTRSSSSQGEEDLTRAVFQLGGVLAREWHSVDALKAFVDVTRVALAGADRSSIHCDSDGARLLARIARTLMDERAYGHAWEAAKSAIETELELDTRLWLGELDARVALLCELFPALIAEGKADQAAETIPLSRQLRGIQATLLDQDELVTEVEALIRDARMLHNGLRDIEAWPMLQEAAAMLPMVKPPVLDRVAFRLADQLIESAIVFYCSSRSAIAIEAVEMVGSMYQEMLRRDSQYNASELRAMFDKLPKALAGIALGTERSAFVDQAAVDDEHGATDDLPGEHSAERRSRILIVDDSALMLDMAKEALEAAGYCVDIAQVLSQITDEDKLRSFDLILIDVMMPELQGDDVAMILRDELTGVKAPIFLLSSLGEQELAQRARQAGIEGYISKRDGIAALVDRVHELLSL